MNRFWSILGIPPTTSLIEIKKAYARQSQLYHPEEAPLEFQELQEAFQAALKWAKNQKSTKPISKREISTFPASSQKDSLPDTHQEQSKLPNPENLQPLNYSHTPDQVSSTDHQLNIADYQTPFSEDQLDQSKHSERPSSEQNEDVLNPSIFQTESDDDYAKQIAYLKRLKDRIAEDTLTPRLLRRALETFDKNGFLTDPDFMTQVNDTLLTSPALDSFIARDQFKTISQDFPIPQLTPAFDYLTTGKVLTEPVQDSSKSKKAFNFRWLWMLLFLIGLILRLSRAFSHLQTYEESQQETLPPPLVLENLQKSTEEIYSKRPDFLIFPELTEENGIHYLIAQDSSQKVELIGATQAFSVFLSTDETTRNIVAASSDNQTWQLYDINGKFLGEIQAELVEHDTLLLTDEGHYILSED